MITTRVMFAQVVSAEGRIKSKQGFLKDGRPAMTQGTGQVESQGRASEAVGGACATQLERKRQYESLPLKDEEPEIQKLTQLVKGEIRTRIQASALSIMSRIT